MEAKDTTLNDFFNTSHYKESKLRIPDYQRPYAWGRAEVERLLDGFYNTFNNKEQTEYLIGNIVLKETEAEESREKSFDVIDGQQRLTTILLMCYFIVSLKITEDNIDNDRYEDAYEHRGYISKITRFKKDRERLDRLEYQDKSAKEEFINFNTYLENESLKNNKINKYISNFSTIKEYFHEKYPDLETNNETRVKLIEDFKYSLDKIKIVLTLLDKKEDELEIFDVMNSTGVPLSIENILKSKFLQKINDKDEKWNKVFRGENDEFWTKKTSSNTNDFLYNYFKIHYISKDGDASIALNKTDKDFREEYYKYLKGLDKKEMESEFNNILKYANCYFLLSNFNLTNSQALQKELNSSDLDDALEDLENLIFVFANWKVWVLFPAVLYCVVEKPHQLKDVSKTLLNIAMYWLIQKKYSTGLNKQIFNLLSLIKNNRSKDITSNITFFNYTDLNKVKTTIAESFNTPFDGKGNIATTIYMMLCIKKSQLPKTKSKTLTPNQLLEIKNKNIKITLEHIYPQNPKKWDKKLPEGEEKLIDYMGNYLILTGPLNSAVSNNTFSVKKVEYEEHARDIPYWTCINKKEDWTDKEIKEMNEQYKKDFIKFFVPKA